MTFSHYLKPENIAILWYFQQFSFFLNDNTVVWAVGEILSVIDRTKLRFLYSNIFYKTEQLIILGYVQTKTRKLSCYNKIDAIFYRKVVT